MQRDPVLPDIVRPCFWDCDLSSLNLRLHQRFIAERILVYGQSAAVRWLLDTIPMSDLKDIVLSGKNLDPKTKNYWRLWFESRTEY
jgi:hypothetical protein